MEKFIDLVERCAEIDDLYFKLVGYEIKSLHQRLFRDKKNNELWHFTIVKYQNL